MNLSNYIPKSEFPQVMIERGYDDNCTSLKTLDKKMKKGAPTDAFSFFQSVSLEAVNNRSCELVC